MNDPHAHCAELVARPGSNLHYSLLFCEPAARRNIVAGHALIEALREVAANAERADLAMAKLSWWSSELDDLRAGRGRHPATLALLDCGGAHFFAKHAAPVLGAVELAITGEGFASFGELEHFAQAMGGRLAAFECEVLHAARADAEEVARIGRALEMLHALRPGPGGPLEHAWMLPGDLLAKSGLRQGQWRDCDRAALRDALASYAQRIGALLEPRSGEEQSAPPSLRSRAQMSRRALVVMARNAFALDQRRLGISPLNKLWIALRNAAGSG